MHVEASGNHLCCVHQLGPDSSQCLRKAAEKLTVVEHPFLQQCLPHAHSMRAGQDAGTLQHQPVHQLCADATLSATHTNIRLWSKTNTRFFFIYFLKAIKLSFIKYNTCMSWGGTSCLGSCVGPWTGWHCEEPSPLSGASLKESTEHAETQSYCGGPMASAVNKKNVMFNVQKKVSEISVRDLTLALWVD